MGTRLKATSGPVSSRTVLITAVIRRVAFAGGQVVRGVRDNAAASLHHVVGGELGPGEVRLTSVAAALSPPTFQAGK